MAHGITLRTGVEFGARAGMLAAASAEAREESPGPQQLVQLISQNKLNAVLCERPTRLGRIVRKKRPRHDGENRPDRNFLLSAGSPG
jgi:hypothetical protein